MSYVTIGKRIGLGFGALLALLITLGSVAIFKMGASSHSAKLLASEYMPEAEIATKVSSVMAKTQLAMRSYGFTGESNYLAEAQSGFRNIHQHLGEARKLSEQHANLTKLKEALDKFEPLLARYEQLAESTIGKNQSVAVNRARLDAEAQSFIKDLESFLENQGKSEQQELTNSANSAALAERSRKIKLTHEIQLLGFNARVAVFKSQALRDPKLIEEGLTNFEAMEKAFAEMTPLVHQAVNLALLDKIKQAAQQYSGAMKEIRADYISLATLAQQRSEAGAQLDSLSDEIATTGMGRTVTAAQASSQELSSASHVMIWGVLASILIGAAISYVIGRRISGVLSAMTHKLDEGANHIVVASGQLSATNQTLAEGASEQAASLEETSSSLEEINSMTRHNAENSSTVNELARQARSAADAGVADMQNMTAAVQAIKSSSDDIAKIIKTIDEIAFQTNILALNAAVEAARAGEAGLGFAVVADEVRNLAQRCAQSAKETASKIEGAVSKTSEGVQISVKVAATLQEIADKVRKVDELAAEVASASKQQEQGISQVNCAVADMDKVTQSTAASAEESASATEELSAQAETLREIVVDLSRLVGGSQHETGARKIPAPQAKRPLANGSFDFEPAQVNGQSRKLSTLAVPPSHNGHSARLRESNHTPANEALLPLQSDRR